MFLQSGLLSELTAASRVFSIATGCSSKWNDTRFKLNRKTFYNGFIICLITSISYACGIYFQIRQRSFHSINKVTLKDQMSAFASIIFGSLFLVTSLLAHTMFKASSLVEAFNTNMVQLERQDFSGSVRLELFRSELKRHRMIKGICRLFRTTIIIPLPIFMGIISVIMPFLQLNAVSFVASCKSIDNELHNSMDWFRTSAFQFGVTAFNWFVQLKVAVFGAINILIGTVGLATGLTLMDIKLQKTISLKLRNKKEWRQSFQKNVVTFRKLQVLVDMFNEIHSILLASIMLVDMICQFTAAIFIVNSQNGNLSEESPIIVTFVRFIFLKLIFHCVLALLSIYGCCANIHFLSTKLVSRLKQLDKETARIIRSMPVVKIMFGSYNFIEKLTPVICQQFVVQRFMEALLVSTRIKK